MCSTNGSSATCSRGCRARRTGSAMPTTMSSASKGRTTRGGCGASLDSASSGTGYSSTRTRPACGPSAVPTGTTRKARARQPSICSVSRYTGGEPDTVCGCRASRRARRAYDGPSWPSPDGVSLSGSGEGPGASKRPGLLDAGRRPGDTGRRGAASRRASAPSCRPGVPVLGDGPVGRVPGSGRRAGSHCPEARRVDRPATVGLYCGFRSCLRSERGRSAVDPEACARTSSKEAALS